MFNLRLNELITAKEKTANEISKATNISQSAISYYINQKREPTMSVLIKLADYFDVTIDYLVGRENDFGNVEIKQDISNEDANLLIGYHKLDNVQKGKVEGYIYAMNEENKDKTKYGG